MDINSVPPEPPPIIVTPPPEVTTVVHRSISLRVDLRALAAIGGALIIVGSFLPWVTPQFQPIVRVFGPATTGGWPIMLFGVLAILLQFWPQFRTPRVSMPAAAIGFAAGILALASAFDTIGIGRTLIGEQAISPLAGVGLGVYLTLAGAVIAILAGLAPSPPNHEPARADLRLWKASTAILAAMLVLCGLGSVMFGSWIGSGGLTGRSGTPTPSVIDAGLLATPLINVQVDPLSGEEPGVGAPETLTPTVEATIPPNAQIVPTNTPEIPPTAETPTLVPTRVPPTVPASPTATHTPLSPATATATATSAPSVIQTPTVTPTPTVTLTETPTFTATP